MISIYNILIILFIHWFADFIMQSDEDAKGKSTSNVRLTSHVLTYTCCWGFTCIYWGAVFNNPYFIITFIPITFFSHWVTDYFTSRLNSKLWAKGDAHNFFVSIGFDQFLHFTQLLLTFLLCIRK